MWKVAPLRRWYDQGEHHLSDARNTKGLKRKAKLNQNTAHGATPPSQTVCVILIGGIYQNWSSCAESAAVAHVNQLASWLSRMSLFCFVWIQSLWCLRSVMIYWEKCYYLSTGILFLLNFFFPNKILNRCIDRYSIQCLIIPSSPLHMLPAYCEGMFQMNMITGNPVRTQFPNLGESLASCYNGCSHHHRRHLGWLSAFNKLLCTNMWQLLIGATGRGENPRTRVPFDGNLRLFRYMRLLNKRL